MTIRIMQFARLSLVLACMGVFVKASDAAVPHLISFQGILKDGSGNPVVDGTHPVKFEIFNSVGPGGGCLWEENQIVTTVDGLFSVTLGSNSQGIPDSAFADSACWLALTIEGDSEELSPRRRLVSTGFSYRVNSIDGAAGGAILGNVNIQSDLSVGGEVDAERVALGVISPGPPQVTPLALMAAPGQSANLMEIKDELGRTRLAVTASGKLEMYDFPGGYAQRFDGIDGGSNNVEFSLDSSGGIRAAGASRFDDKVSIGTSASGSKLCVGGAIATSVLSTGCNPISLDETNSVVLSPGSGGGCSVSLPSAVGISGRQYTIKQTGNGQTNVVAFGGQFIDGSPVYILSAPNKYVTVVCDGANWWVIGSN